MVRQKLDTIAKTDSNCKKAWVSKEEKEDEKKFGATPHLCENREKGGGGGGGPLGRRDQLRLTCVSAGAPLWLDGATTDALSRLIFLKIDF